MEQQQEVMDMTYWKLESRKQPHTGTVGSWSGARALGKRTHATENLNTQRWVCIQLLPKLETQDELEPFQLALIASRVSEIKGL